MVVQIEVSGNFHNTERFLKKMSKREIFDKLQTLAKAGVTALAANTPVDSGLTAESWNYEIKRSRGSTSITWTNSNTINGQPLAVMLQYGHGTGTGGYVVGRNYINPAMAPVFEMIADETWKLVESA